MVQTICIHENEFILYKIIVLKIVKFNMILELILKKIWK